jgi:hypothetical protein
MNGSKTGIFSVISVALRATWVYGRLKVFAIPCMNIYGKYQGRTGSRCIVGSELQLREHDLFQTFTPGIHKHRVPVQLANSKAHLTGMIKITHIMVGLRRTMAVENFWVVST